MPSLFDDPQTLAQLQLAAGLMGGGNFGQALQRGLLGYTGTIANAQEAEFKRAQLADIQQQAALRNQQLQMALQKAAMQREAFYGADSGSPSGGSGATPITPASINGTPSGAQATNSPGLLGAGGPPSAAPNSQIAELNRLRRMAIAEVPGAKELFDIHKYQNDPQKRDAGNWYQTPGGPMVYVPDPNKANSYDAQGNVVVQPGFNAAASSTALATDLPKAFAGQAFGGSIRREPGPNGRDVYVANMDENPFMRQFGEAIFGRPAGAPAQPQPETATPPGMLNREQFNQTPLAQAQAATQSDPSIRASELIAARQRLARATTPQEQKNAQDDITALSREMMRLPAGQQVAQATTTRGYGLSPNELVTQEAAKQRALQPIEAGNKINETWLKTSYEPVVTAGNAANDLINNVEVARNSMRAMGGTGWGKETMATGANVLTSLGVAPKSAEMLATNAQTFQSAAMSNLQTVLNAAKGPQTDGDADRASKTFAQLKNTPQANEFILDIAQARAQRDAVKAQFYAQALPLAREKGDLQEVDREWEKRAPSIFSMPTMLRWSK